MAWGALAASIGKGFPGRRSSGGKPSRRPAGKPRRKLTTSQAAIYRAEARKNRRKRAAASGPSRGTSRPRPTTRSINTGPRRGRPTRRRKAHCK